MKKNSVDKIVLIKVINTVLADLKYFKELIMGLVVMILKVHLVLKNVRLGKKHLLLLYVVYLINKMSKLMQ